MSLAVVLMTYGAPRTPGEVGPYLARVRGGNEPSPELVAEFVRRYETIGWSPVVARTEAQATALERLLRDSGLAARVVAGMRYSAPAIEQRVAELALFAPEVVIGICMSPQWSPMLMGGYEAALHDAVARSLPHASVAMAHEWHREPRFVDALAERTREALARLGDDVPLLLTAHSLPRRVFDAETEYVAQLRETAELVAARLDLPPEHWRWAYQSAGHTAEEWLRPDLKELFPTLAAAGHRDVLVAPVQFLADHLEVLYDLDVAAAAEARACGLRYHRIAMPNTQPMFLRALRDVVERTRAARLVTEPA